MSAANNDYVLVTAAYNEERYIAKTIESVINQTIPPKRWVIVSDGSNGPHGRYRKRPCRTTSVHSLPAER